MHVKSLRRIVLMVVAMVASSLSLVAVSTAPAHAAGVPTDTHITINRTTVTYGTTVTLTGWASVEGETEPGGAGTFRLERKVYGQTSWTSISTKDSAGDNKVTWTVTPAKTAYYRIRFLGNTASLIVTTYRY